MPFVADPYQTVPAACPQGASLVRLADGGYKEIPGDRNLVDTLDFLGFKTFVEALRVSGRAAGCLAAIR